MSILSKNGYSISLANQSDKDLKEYIKDTTIIPNVPQKLGFVVKPKPIKLSIKTDKRLYLPRYYGLEKLGKPTLNRFTDGTDIDINFKGDLRPHQTPIVKKTLKQLNDKGGGIISLYCGGGKCHGKNTPILMYNGDIKMVQNIRPGELIMGDDSTPRQVYSTCTGREKLYRIIPQYGNPYVVNRSHILSLKASRDYKNKYVKGDIVDISVKKYLRKSKEYRKYLLSYKMPFTFKEIPTRFNPYIIGYWLFNCNDNNIYIGNSQIRNAMISFLKPYNLYLDYVKPLRYTIKSTNSTNLLLLYLTTSGLDRNRHLPKEYKCNSKTNQLLILAGIIDAIAITNKTAGEYKLYIKNPTLMNDVIFLCNSLGLIHHKNGDDLIINGLNMNNPYIQSNENQLSYIGKNTLCSRFKIESLNKGNFYGFELDGNNRYLLSDGIVTHNTAIACYIIGHLKDILSSNKKTLIIVHTTDLVIQWKERIGTFLPDANVGIIQQNKMDVMGKDIVIGMVQSISMRDYPDEIFENFGFVVYDECHLMCTKIFSKSFRKTACKYTLGLSATPYRPDKCENVFFYNLGPMIHYEKRAKNDKIIAKSIKFKIKDYELKYMNNGNVNYTGSVIDITKNELRNKHIVSQVLNLMREGRKILILSSFVSHLETLYDMIEKYMDDYKVTEWTKDKHKLLYDDEIKSEIENILKSNNLTVDSDISDNIIIKINEIVQQDSPNFSYGLYIGRLKKQARAEAQNCDVILGTYKLASVGMDIPALNTLLFASPIKNIEQAVGRILRGGKDSGLQPLIIDYVDNCGIFMNQGRVRKAFYESYGYNVIEIKLDEDGNEIVKKKRAVKKKKEEKILFRKDI